MWIPIVYQSIQQSLKRKEFNCCAKYWIIIYNVVINVQERWMNFYYDCLKYDIYFRRRRYLFDKNDDCVKTLGDSKPKHYHIYMNTEKKVKAIKPQTLIYVFTASSLYCCIAAKIFICCRWLSSHKCLNGWIYLRW